MFGEVISGADMAVIDENAAALGVPRKQLMESSGNALAREVRAVVDPDDSVTVVAGRGNNGGDALVATRFLDEFDPLVLLLGRAETITTDIARENWDALQAADYDTVEARDSTAVDLGDPDAVVDAMLGTGISGALREPAATAAAAIDDSDATVVSADVPSGYDAKAGTLPETAVHPDRIVTFHKPKPGLAELDASVTVAEIGIPAAAETVVEHGDLTRLSRPADSHKGTFGEVLVVGGGPYTGAPALAGQAALRAGADLVRVACPESVADAVAASDESLIVRPFSGDRFAPGDDQTVLDLAAEHDAVCLGPGLGDDDATLAAVRSFLAAYEGVAVVDADALSGVPDVETDATLLCTPHQGELAGMGGPSAEDWRDRATAVTDFAADMGHTLLVTGRYDVISDGSDYRVNRTGNPGMTVGGTGDVLAGTAAALAATHDVPTAAVIGAYVVGAAGDRIVDDQGYGLVATDLPPAVPRVMWGVDDE